MLARSSFAILAGLVATIALSIAADMAMIRLALFGRDGSPVGAAGFPIATLYRCLFDLGGCWLAGRLAPAHPMRHALILGGIGFGLALLGLAAEIASGGGPLWYPAALVVTALPCAWLGGSIEARRRGC